MTIVPVLIDPTGIVEVGSYKAFVSLPTRFDSQSGLYAVTQAIESIVTRDVLGELEGTLLISAVQFIRDQPIPSHAWTVRNGTLTTSN